ncbi:nickel pincer cofactor biosynthesis protein LarC [Candidatus Desulfofervidus auxilii]|nr:nickel pincer cofactor biosynthesis protein LarC [Candidatus Desulfofervidus auxilii]
MLTLNNKFCYFDLFNGISGDMAIAAFIDAGFPVDKINETLSKLNLNNVKLHATKVVDKGISGTRISIDTNSQNHWHNYKDIASLIKNSKLEKNIQNIALKILEVLAKAEAKIHNLPLNDVHFHEVGAIDTIVDIISFATIIHEWNLTNFFVSPLPFFKGTVETQHGILPLPAPAVVEILKGYKWKPTNIEGELITPTGAAILKAVNAQQIDTIFPHFCIEKIGHGFGTKSFKNRANYLRVFTGIIHENSASYGIEEEIHGLEFQLDDITPEVVGYIKEKLESFPVLDYMIIPVQMKKERPGFYFKIFIKENYYDLLNFIFQQTGTLGIRISPIKRIILKREIKEIDTPYGKIRCKIAYFKNKAINIKPEFEDCKRIATEKNIPFKKLLQDISSYLKVFYE